jgi:hypothetical protein
MLLEDLRLSIEDTSAKGRSEAIAAVRQWHWRLLKSWLLRASAGQSGLLMLGQRYLLTTRLALQADLLTRRRARAEVHLARCGDAIAMVERARFLRAWTRDLERSRASGGPREEVPVVDSGRLDAADLDETRAVGFRPASVFDEAALRWSEPAAYVELPLPVGRSVVRLRWLGSSLLHGEPRPRFFLDERPIPPEDVALGRDCAELRVHVSESPSPTRLGWVCRATPSDRGDRPLGLPLVSVDWAREDDRACDAEERSSDRAEVTRPS